MMKKTTWFGALVLLSLTAGACGGNGEPEGEEAELCEHMAEGPGAAVTATADGTGASVAADHTRYDVTLSSQARSVSFASDHAEDLHVALNKNIPITVTDSSGATIAIEETKTSDLSCGDLKVVYTLPLPVGTSVIAFGGTDTSVSVVVEHAAHANE